ncbi:MAG: urease accessory UreF family protein [Thermodesulfobacteriota bacterium]
MTEAHTSISPFEGLPLLRLLQLVSPGLPVGAYAYSQGMEQAAAGGWLRSAMDVEAWVEGLLRHSLARLEVPLFKRFYEAWQLGDLESLAFWSHWLLASRGTAELQAEERHMGRALQRLLVQLEVLSPELVRDLTPTFVALFAAAACFWRIPLARGCEGLLWAWAENQVTAAIKLVPLGQTQGQRILMGVAGTIGEIVSEGLAFPDGEIGASAPALGLASARHETQHTRLFRS